MIIVIIIIIIITIVIIIIIIIIIIMIQNKVFAQCIIKIKMSHDVNTPPTHLDIKKKNGKGYRITFHGVILYTMEKTSSITNDQKIGNVVNNSKVANTSHNKVPTGAIPKKINFLLGGMAG